MAEARTLERTVVYVGPNLLIPGDRSGPPLQPDTRYICFEKPNYLEGPGLTDLDRDAINNLANPFARPAATYIHKGDAPAKQVHESLPEEIRRLVDLRFVSARATGLEPDSVDEVHIYNVLSDSSVGLPIHFFLEAFRILRKGGSLYTGETLSPENFPLREALRMPGVEPDNSTVLFGPLEGTITPDEMELVERLTGRNLPSSVYPGAYILKVERE